MGLNVNYSLLIEGNNSTSSIPKYTRYYTPGFIAESEFEACISEFNQEIRESKRFLTSICEAEYVNEASAAVNFSNGVKFIAEKVKKAVIKVMTLIIEGIKKAIDSIEKFASAARTKVDMKLRPNERLNILRKVLANAEEPITVSIASIEPTRDLLDKSFPDTSILGSDLVKMATDTMNNYCTNIIQKDGSDASLLNDTEVKASETFVNFIESEKNKMLAQIFGRYSYDETAITKSAHEVADKAFGTSEKSEVKLSDSLYLAACDNLEKNSLNGIVRDMKATMDVVQKNYKAVVAEMDTISDSVKYFDKIAGKNQKFDMKERYHKATRIVTERVNRALNVIQQVVNADFVLITRKASRTYEIYGVMGDSAKVKNKCDVLIIKEIGARAGYNLNPTPGMVSESDDISAEKYQELYDRLNEATVSRSEIIDTVNKALEADGLKSHISKNGEWGSKKFIEGKDNCLCLGSFNKDTYEKAYNCVKNCLPDGCTCSKDSYFTLFVNAPEIVKESTEVFNGREEADEFFRIQENFNMATVLAEEAFLEESFTEKMMTAILEAEGDQQQNAGATGNAAPSSNTPQATETTVSQTTKITTKSGAIMEFVQKIIASFGQAMQRFRNRLDELIIKNPVNQQYWQKNKENIQKLTLADTKVNEWYDYKIDYFSNSTFIKFDQNSPDLKDDEAFQNAIIKKITGGNGNLPQFGEKDTFAQKINKIYQGEFTKDDNGEGKTLQEVNYNHAKAFALVDEMMTRGFGGEILGKVVNDYKEIDTDYKAVKRNYDSIAAQMKPATNAEQKATEAENKKPEPQNAAAMVEDDFRFNLAEHFGLVHNEASFTVGQNDAQSANANGAGDSKSESNKELDAMIKRCFQFNTVAVTAKMTAALGAYKQYMGLFKAVYKPAKNEAPKQQNDQKQEGNAAEAKPAEEKK